MSPLENTESRPLVLFVDDDHEAVIEHRRALAAHCQTYLCRTLNGAVRFLETAEGRQVKLVVIDLLIPGNHGLLDRYESSVPDDLTINQGQLLAAWLRAHRLGLPFVYLSAFSEASTDRDVKCFSKNPLTMPDLIDHIRWILAPAGGENAADTGTTV